jgi:hypothetical protein
MEWLIQRGCPLKLDATDDEKAEAKKIRDAWLQFNGGGALAEEAAQDTHKPDQGEGESPPVPQDCAEEEYEYVGTLPDSEAPRQELPSPSDAPEEISLTSLKAPLEQSEPVQGLETQCVSASSSPQTASCEDSSLRLPG